MKATSKVHGELMAARKAKRAAKGETAVEAPAETVETTPVAIEAAPAKGKRGKKAAEAAAAKPTEPVDTADDGEEVCVFAIRLLRSERDLIHAVAGSGKATRFVKTVALAAARGDIDTLHGIVAEIVDGKRR
jgi:hypothetical protein